MSKQMTMLKKFSLTAALSVYILMVVGAYVSAVGAGLACGRDWPLCEGRIIPRWDPLVLAEYIHRAFTLVVTFFVLGTTVIALKNYGSSRGVSFAAVSSSLLLITQVFLGMLVVVGGIEPLLRTLHLALATALFGTTVATALLVWKTE